MSHALATNITIGTIAVLYLGYLLWRVWGLLR